MRNKHDRDLSWLGELVSSGVSGFCYWCTEQLIVQRFLSGKDEQEARRGTIFGD